MPIVVAVPTTEEQQQLLAVHAHRFPQRAKIPVAGDRGARLSLPALLGVPSGACKMPSGAIVSPAWRELVDTLAKGQRLSVSDMAEALAADCMLWPDGPTRAEWRARWPRLSEDIALAVLGMIGALPSVVEEPSVLERVPEHLQAELEERPRAVWRRLKPTGASFDVVIDTPSSTCYDVYTDAVRQPDADMPDLVQQLAEGQVVACFDRAGARVPALEVMARYPGLAIYIAVEARALGGAQGEVFFDEW